MEFLPDLLENVESDIIVSQSSFIDIYIYIHTRIQEGILSKGLGTRVQTSRYLSRIFIDRVVCTERGCLRFLRFKEREISIQFSSSLKVFPFFFFFFLYYFHSFLYKINAAYV